MVNIGCVCDRCGHEHGTPNDNRSFRWCRRIKGTICGKCCNECEYCNDWRCTYDPAGREKMRMLVYANKAAERTISKNEDIAKKVSIATRRMIEQVNENLKAEINAREEEYDKLRAREGEEPEMF